MHYIAEANSRGTIGEIAP